jgi:hypothetical protein
VVHTDFDVDELDAPQVSRHIESVSRALDANGEGDPGEAAEDRA